MKKLEYVVYEGERFTIEWYYDSRGRSQALEYSDVLSDDEKAKLSRLFVTLADIGEIQNTEKFRYEGDKIYAFKPKPHRFMSFFYSGSKVIITNAFVKKQDKLPPVEKERALKCMQNYEQRIKEGTYYGKD